MQSIAVQIALLQQKSVLELQELWKKYFNEPTTIQSKEFFVSRNCIIKFFISCRHILSWICGFNNFHASAFSPKLYRIF